MKFSRVLSTDSILTALLHRGPVASLFAGLVLVTMVGGSWGVIRTGRWGFRLVLVIVAGLWPWPDHDLQGPILMTLSYRHGIHLSDLLSVVAIAIAVLPVRALAVPPFRQRRSGGESR